jgi:hypothetical protein
LSVNISYFKSKHPSWTPVFSADENLRAGFHYTQRGNVERAPPQCWAHIVNASRTEQAGAPARRRRNLADRINKPNSRNLFYFF